MNLTEIISAVAKMFPQTDIAGAVKKAQGMLPAQLPNDLKSAQKIARELGIDSDFAKSIYDRYGKSVQARAICKVLGTTPEALKEDADTLLGREEKRLPRL